jgi:hypothetical protein
MTGNPILNTVHEGLTPRYGSGIGTVLINFDVEKRFILQRLFTVFKNE